MEPIFTLQPIARFSPVWTRLSHHRVTRFSGAIAHQSGWGTFALTLSRLGCLSLSALRDNPLRLFNRHPRREATESEERPIGPFCPSADVDFSILTGTGDRAHNVNPLPCRKSTLKQGPGSRPRLARTQCEITRLHRNTCTARMAPFGLPRLCCRKRSARRRSSKTAMSRSTRKSRSRFIKRTVTASVIALRTRKPVTWAMASSRRRFSCSALIAASVAGFGLRAW